MKNNWLFLQVDLVFTSIQYAVKALDKIQKCVPMFTQGRQVVMFTVQKYRNYFNQALMTSLIPLITIRKKDFVLTIM